MYSFSVSFYLILSTFYDKILSERYTLYSERCQSLLQCWSPSLYSINSFSQSHDETKGVEQLVCVPPYSDLLWDDVSLSHMDVDAVQRGWQEQVLALTVEGQTLQTHYMGRWQWPTR